MPTKIERLEKLIEDQENQITELEDQLENMTYHEQWKWRAIRELDEKENLGLPVPRLELRNRKVSKYSRIVDYGLVHRHLLGHIEFIPIGSTKIDGGRETYTNLLQKLPIRDGAHIYHDMWELKLRGFIVDFPECQELSFDDEDVPLE